MPSDKMTTTDYYRALSAMWPAMRDAGWQLAGGKWHLTVNGSGKVISVDKLTAVDIWQQHGTTPAPF